MIIYVVIYCIGCGCKHFTIYIKTTYIMEYGIISRKYSYKC